MAHGRHSSSTIKVTESVSTRDLARKLEKFKGQLISVETTGNPGEDEIGILLRVRKGLITLLDEGKTVYIAIDKISSFEPATSEEG
jgi:ribosome maturation factor RimP